MNIVLGVSGGIAAYKAPELVRRLRDAGADVRVILTPNAARFVSPLSLAAVSNHGVIVEQWGDAGHGGVDHIELARWAELLFIAPATANVIAKLTAGIADDALTTYALAHRAELVIAPAMNTFMLAHPTVQQNIETLRARGAGIIEPVNGLLACGEEGAGKMPDVPLLVEHIRGHFASRDLDGKSVLVTAGPTREPLDPVRYLSNRSSGKMGYALAEAARRRGANVTLVTGPTALPAPAGVALTRVTTAAEMHAAVLAAAPHHQIVIKAAAVADFAAANVADQKIKKSESSDELTLRLVKNPDILADVARVSPRPFIVAFAAETEAVEEQARAKLQRKGADLIVANDVADRTIGFDSDQNEALVIAKDGEVTRLAKAGKLAIANRVLDIVVGRLAR
ncbi:MAG: bifunctional phosphopantothenoylcysteine decarboxylase/phosphopantothenate--cysteine ligase CoaBC [Acidobacteria bacterium]|nr:bifunctional phosphopantothenoylcysteine decarboxylase/phosphopantothenate--cysteine ligase CoaBC [Acidobacteriota bacterium]MBV9474562.1 bifunctional phosphopantothenoylcysteine decarboxylase/phosphopantothenate--cysteine ligase CoaBC [Acidobacteriota bacterium]